MQLVRTTLRINSELKKKAEMVALTENTTLQAIFNQALLEHLAKRKANKAKAIKIISFDLGAGLDNLTRDDIYGEPDTSRL
ncbi:hypothetical protein A2803_00640 [Candidatus Woesebacteria bacterium RIFCSPHIGHO2_01_FULL_44_21]|uniref:Uncharacterized protein n=1 Tax=Candidatus Woesebacteria bacterium RIFCSPHIGHO2_01_FULL_44_21 TaxID=1802503 RepID=A0A1F7YXX1_9BACT|nr:MAG: hypothetical protein A2803_00640 [Candidatus Woesebacteria bacterium RIFCSPHIGHO2_01_FULL_44_21]OGM70370.1 MAG: hypothetical protein A2897_01070 [Candidatus Woesebacteria bacterium RIFCSPLOWO2_01_FULL_44_24b]